MFGTCLCCDNWFRYVGSVHASAQLEQLALMCHDADAAVTIMVAIEYLDFQPSS
jgi:hypothetical protein